MYFVKKNVVMRYVFQVNIHFLLSLSKVLS